MDADDQQSPHSREIMAGLAFHAISSGVECGTITVIVSVETALISTLVESASKVR